MRILLILLSLTFIITSFQKETKTIVNKSGTLQIKLSNIRNTKGYIYIFIYAYKNQYPYSPYKYYKVNKSSVKNGKITTQILNLNFQSNYAITLIDDENNNEDLDRWLGIPDEGYGFSNNVRPFLSVPKYEDLLFNFKTSSIINIKLQYVL